MRWLLLAVGLIGCGSSVEGTTTDAIRGCQPLHGTYRVDLVVRSGTCGPLPQSLTNADAAGAAPDGCTVVANSSSADRCERDFEAHCVIGTATLDETIVIHIADTFDGATGSMQLIILDPSGGTSCTGLYDMTYTRA